MAEQQQAAGTIDDGGPAYPTEVGGVDQKQNWHQTGPNTAHFHGMSLRDYFAAKAMQAMFTGFAKGSDRVDAIYEVCAREAYAVADAMIAASKSL